MEKKIKYIAYMKRVFIAHSMLAIIIIFCLYIASLFITYHFIVVKKTKIANIELSSIVADDLAAYVQDIEEIVDSETIKQAIRNKDATYRANELLYAFRRERSFKGNYVLLDSKADIVSTNLYKRTSDRLQESFLLQRTLKLLNEGEQVHQRTDGLELDNGYKSRYLFGYSVTEEEGILGYLLFLLEDNHNAFPAVTDFTIVTDRFDNVLFSSDPLLITSMGKSLSEIQEGKKMIKIGEENYYMSTTSLQGGEFKTHNLTSVRLFKQFVLIGVASFFAITVVMGLLMYVLSPATTKESRRSFNNLLGFIKNPERKGITQPFEEFQQIEDEFMKKMAQIDELIARNQEIEETKRKMEIKQLENQFNPHFAFNVLEMLRYEISFDPKNAQEIIVSFANLMRYSTYYGDTTIPLGTDMKYVTDYLMIQKMRFQERLDYVMNVEEGLEEIEVPKLILQPLIENSIKHNIERVRHLMITINIITVEDKLHINIEDNGLGMEADRLIQLRRMIDSGENRSEHYGLYYCQRVIRLLYGENYGLQIMRNEQNGTIVTVVLPKGEKNHHV